MPAETRQIDSFAYGFRNPDLFENLLIRGGMFFASGNVGSHQVQRSVQFQELLDRGGETQIEVFKCQNQQIDIAMLNPAGSRFSAAEIIHVDGGLHAMGA